MTTEEQVFVRCTLEQAGVEHGDVHVDGLDGDGYGYEVGEAAAGTGVGFGV